MLDNIKLLVCRLLNVRFVLIGRVRIITEDVNTGEIEVTEWKKNLVVTAGKVALLRRMGNIALNANEGMITYGAVGTGTSTPLVSQTVLATELARKAVSSKSIAGSILTIRVFYTTSEANGTLTEFAWFGEAATAAADSGTMFNRILISKTKTATKTLTIEQTFEYA